MPPKPTAKLKKLDSLREQAIASLEKGDLFDADRAAYDALMLAYAMDLYERMPEITNLLKEARGRRFREAIEIGTLSVLDDPEYRTALVDPEIDEDLAPGCYLLQPPLVGADGRNLRDLCFAKGVPAAFLVREPETREGVWPIVMIGPITVRAYVPPPKGGKPTLDWFEDTAYELGDSAIETVNADAPPTVRVNELLDRLGTVVLHDRLLDLLAETCVLAHEQLIGEREAAEKKASDKADKAAEKAAEKSSKAAGG